MRTSGSNDNQVYLTVSEAADRIRMSKSFLDKLRVNGGGPRFIKNGSRVVYRVGEIDMWMREREFASTSEIPADLAA